MEASTLPKLGSTEAHLPLTDLLDLLTIGRSQLGKIGQVGRACRPGLGGQETLELQQLFRTRVFRASCTACPIGQTSSIEPWLLLPTCYLGKSPAASAVKWIGLG